VEKKLYRLGDVDYGITELPRFGVILEGPLNDPVSDCLTSGAPIATGATGPLTSPQDYLHQHLLVGSNRDSFFELIRRQGLVICRQIANDQPGYRKVRGKSNPHRLSPAEYYHHDGSEGGNKPLLVEIHLPVQHHQRDIATAIAPFPDVLRGMWQALPTRLRMDSEMVEFFESFQQTCFWDFDRANYLAQASAPAPDPPPIHSHWEQIQGRITRLVRKEYDAESCRSYFREVDRLAGAFDIAWQMGESRLMLNNHPDLALTCQHRRALVANRTADRQTGSLLKRWTAEEYC
jgi:hypothetical protein